MNQGTESCGWVESIFHQNPVFPVWFNTFLSLSFWSMGSFCSMRTLWLGHKEMDGVFFFNKTTNLLNRLENGLPGSQYKCVTNIFKIRSTRSLVTQLSNSHFFHHPMSPFQFLLQSHVDQYSRAQCGWSVCVGGIFLTIAFHFYKLLAYHSLILFSFIVPYSLCLFSLTNSLGFCIRKLLRTLLEK